MSDEEKFDGVLMGICQQAKGIDGFLEAVFGFLRRKTDFFSNHSNNYSNTIMYLLQISFIRGC